MCVAWDYNFCNLCLQKIRFSMALYIHSIFPMFSWSAGRLKYRRPPELCLTSFKLPKLLARRYLYEEVSALNNYQTVWSFLVFVTIIDAVVSHFWMWSSRAILLISDVISSSKQKWILPRNGKDNTNTLKGINNRLVCICSVYLFMQVFCRLTLLCDWWMLIEFDTFYALDVLEVLIVRAAPASIIYNNHMRNILRLLIRILMLYIVVSPTSNLGISVTIFSC